MVDQVVLDLPTAKPTPLHHSGGSQRVMGQSYRGDTRCWLQRVLQFDTPAVCITGLTVCIQITAGVDQKWPLAVKHVCCTVHCPALAHAAQVDAKTGGSAHCAALGQQFDIVKRDRAAMTNSRMFSRFDGMPPSEGGRFGNRVKRAVIAGN